MASRGQQQIAVLSSSTFAFTICFAVWMMFAVLGIPIKNQLGLNIVGISMAVGKASVFKFIGDDYSDNIGAVSGVVGLAGGLDGFVLPILFGALVDLTGVRSSAFMLLYGTVCVSLVWMHFSFKDQGRAAARPALAAVPA